LLLVKENGRGDLPILCDARLFVALRWIPPPEAFFEQVTQLLGQAFKGAEDVLVDPPLRSGEGHWMIRIEWGNQPWGNAYLARSVF